MQRGNADDALMRVMHGPDWYAAAGETTGRQGRHLAIVGTALSAAGLAAAGCGRTARTLAAAALGGIGEFATARIVPGPRTFREIATMTLTSVAIPPVAVWHWLRGTWAARGARPWPPRARAILFDRDGTLIHDVPYNGDPSKVSPVPGARAALELAREHGLRVGVVTNQSGVARGRISPAEVAAVNARVESLLGPFGTWQVCPHGPRDGCLCRKPAPGMIRRAAEELGVDPADCVVIGDIGADITAAHAAGARAVLVPTEVTRREELSGVRVAGDLREAVEIALGHTTAPLNWAADSRQEATP
jgi:HAD superfamily hydrolase (TIGR01662 family)